MVWPKSGGLVQGAVTAQDPIRSPLLTVFEIEAPMPMPNPAEFLTRLREHHLPRLDALGVEYRPLDGPHPWQTRPGVPGRPR